MNNNKTYNSINCLKIVIAYIPETLISMYYGGTSNNGIGSYFRSFTEGNRALRENGYKFCLCISVVRTIRVLLQFRLC